MLSVSGPTFEPASVLPRQSELQIIALDDGGSITGKDRDFSLHQKVQNGFRARAAKLILTLGSFLEGRADGARIWPLVSSCYRV